LSEDVADIVVHTAHARHVGGVAREAFSSAAAAIDRDPRVLVLRTCHRVDVYAVQEHSSDGPSPALPLIPAGGRRLEGLEAVRHVLACAAGLDSVVIGEDQVLHQMRDSVAERRSVGQSPPRSSVATTGDRSSSLHPVLERLLQTALRVGRAARSRRQGPARSLADIAVEELAGIPGTMEGRRLLLVGAGRMARLAAVAASRHGVEIVVANRDRSRALTLANEIHGTVVDLDGDIVDPSTSGILIAISGAWSPSTADRRRLLASTCPVVDLSSPPALDSALRQDLGSRYLSSDDIAHRPQDERPARMSHRLERELAVAEADFIRWLETRDAVPAIAALSAEAERHRRQELERLFRRTNLPPRERELVEQMSRRLVAGLLHRPMAALREDPDETLERATRALFSL
jgi:glutamyl-tRNA reductase